MFDASLILFFTAHLIGLHLPDLRVLSGAVMEYQHHFNRWESSAAPLLPEDTEEGKPPAEAPGEFLPLHHREHVDILTVSASSPPAPKPTRKHCRAWQRLLRKSLAPICQISAPSTTPAAYAKPKALSRISHTLPITWWFRPIRTRTSTLQKSFFLPNCAATTRAPLPPVHHASLGPNLPPSTHT